jgi:hypothetical protein
MINKMTKQGQEDADYSCSFDHLTSLAVRSLTITDYRRPLRPTVNGDVMAKNDT